MAKVRPYLKFDGKCREAFEFYRDCLDAELTIQSVGESPMAGTMPAESHKSILHADITKGDLTIYGSDMVGPDVKQGNTTVLCITSADTKELRQIFDKLADGGKITTPLKDEFFGTYGDLTDKFGVLWMFQSDKKTGE